MEVSSADHAPVTESNYCLQACPGGYFGDTRRECTYSPRLIARYEKWFAGFLLDDPAGPAFIKLVLSGAPHEFSELSWEIWCAHGTWSPQLPASRQARYPSIACIVRETPDALMRAR